MNNSYPEDLDLINGDYLSSLNIAVTKDGEFTFACDWEPTDEGIKAVASIFYGITYDDLTEQILSEVKHQCVLKGNHSEFLDIVECLKALLSASKDDEHSAERNDSLVVPPRNVLKL